MELVSHWRLWWRRWSTWLAGLNAALWAYITAHSGMLLGFLPFVNREWRGIATGAVFAIMFVVPVLVRHIKQPAIKDKGNG